MVCAKCQKKLKSTALATPAVKKKNEFYYGSPAGSSGRVEKSSASTAAGKVSTLIDYALLSLNLLTNLTE